MINDPIIRVQNAIGTPKEGRILVRYANNLKTARALSQLLANAANARAKITMSQSDKTTLSSAFANKRNVINSKLLGRALSEEEGRMVFFKMGLSDTASYLALAAVEYICACRLFRESPTDPELIREAGNNIVQAILSLENPAEAIKLLKYAKKTFPAYLKPSIEGAIDDFSEQAELPPRIPTAPSATSPRRQGIQLAYQS